VNVAILIIPYHDSDKQVIGAIPELRHKDVVIFDPLDSDPVGINPINPNPDSQNNSRYVEGTVLTIQNVAKGSEADSAVTMGDHMIELADKGLSVFASLFGTLAHFELALSDPNYMAKAVSCCNLSLNDKMYFNEILPKRDETGRESKTSLRNRVRFYTDDPLKHVFCQNPPTITADEIIDKNLIVILDMHKGVLGHYTAKAFAATMYWTLNTALELKGTGSGKTLTTFADEYPAWATPDMTKMIARGRGFGARTVVAGQYLGQMSPEMQDSLLTGLRTKIGFRMNSDDAQRMEREIGISAKALINLDNRECYCKVGSRTHHLAGLPPIPEAPQEVVDKIRKQTAEKYGGKKVVFDRAYYKGIFPKEKRSHQREVKFNR
jgi:hypothetical protein